MDFDPDDKDADDVQGDDEFDALLRSSAKIPLPELFYSEETHRPFTRCIDCNVPLLQEPFEVVSENHFQPAQASSIYQIQKLIVGGESVFEFAMCERCLHRLQSRFSTDTRNAVTEHFSERVDPATWLLTPEDPDESDVRCYLSSCLLCHRPQSLCHRYGVSGFCIASRLILGPGLFLICDRCEREVNELISEKTRREWDRFVEEHFDFPPGVGVDEPGYQPILL